MYSSLAIPSTARQLHDRIYAGEIIRFTDLQSMTTLVEFTRAFLESALHPWPPQQIHRYLSHPEQAKRFAKCQNDFARSAEIQQRWQNIVQSLGIAPIPWLAIACICVFSRIANQGSSRRVPARRPPSLFTAIPGGRISTRKPTGGHQSIPSPQGEPSPCTRACGSDRCAIRVQISTCAPFCIDRIETDAMLWMPMTPSRTCWKRLVRRRG